MNARNELAGILAQWRQLTQAEGKAIEQAAWPALRQIQAQKAHLKHPLAEAVQKCAAEGDWTAFPFRTEVARIISLLTRNGEALAARVRQARAQQEALDQTKRNLQRIQRSYVRTPARGRWHSYS